MAKSKGSKAAAEKARNDLVASGRVETQVETQTVVEDHTEAPADARPVNYKVERVELGDGTILETVGEPESGSAPVEDDSKDSDA